jgi:hypothetical protein
MKRTPRKRGVSDSIGAAFSSDGIHWRKYPQPVVDASEQASYGAGHPAVYNSDRKSAIWMFLSTDSACQGQRILGVES